MSKIPSVEEKVDEFMSQYAWGKFFTIELEQEVRENLVQTLTADRTALLTELKDSGLLEEKDGWYTVPGSESEHGKITSRDKRIIAHNTLAKAIKARLDELIKSNSI